MSKRKIIKNISLIAIFIALTFIGTYFLKVPYAGGAGFFNLSDAFIIFSTIYCGPVVGLISGTIGAMLGDLASGYINFIVFTFFAKALESIVSYLLFYFLRKTKYLKYISFIFGALMMVITYLISYLVLFDITYCYMNVVFDLVQGIVNVIIGIALLLIMQSVPLDHYDINKVNLFNKKDKKTSYFR